MKKETKVQLLTILILIIILGILTVITIKEMNNQNNPSQMYDRDMIKQEFGHPNEENTEKETKANDINEGQEVTRKQY